MTEKSQLRIEDGCVRLSGELTFSTTPELYGQLEEKQQADSVLRTIDLSEVTAADSSGLALLLEWQASRQQGSGELRIENAPTNLLRLARLCEAEELLNIRGREKGQ